MPVPTITVTRGTLRLRMTGQAPSDFVQLVELRGSSGQYRLMGDKGVSGSVEVDATILSRSVRDPDRFAVIVERHATPVFRYLVSRVGRSAAEDLFADAFEAAFKARDRYDARYDSALPWLLGIATNVVRHHRRSEGRHAAMVERVTQNLGRAHAPREATDEVAISIERDDEMQAVRRALAVLGERHREVLVLSAGLGLSYEDVARTLGIRVGTVRSRLARARRRLRELLELDGQYAGHDDPTRCHPVAEEPSP
jgi:RNA polymerase sigma-70 factor, ECF subfamily